MTGQRRYAQSCPVAHALDLVGDRWALLVVRELRLGPRRFGDLASALPGIAPSVLTQRLTDLVAVGVLERIALTRPDRADTYRLTAWGSDLEPVFVALARWGARSPVVPLEGPISDDAVMLGVRTFFPSNGPATLSGDVVVLLTRERYLLRLVGGTLAALDRLPRDDQNPPAADATLATDADTLRSLLVGTLTPATALASGAIVVTGNEVLGEGLLEAMVRRR